MRRRLGALPFKLPTASINQVLMFVLAIVRLVFRRQAESVSAATGPCQAGVLIRIRRRVSELAVESRRVPVAAAGPPAGGRTAASVLGDAFWQYFAPLHGWLLTFQFLFGTIFYPPNKWQSGTMFRGGCFLLDFNLPAFPFRCP